MTRIVTLLPAATEIVCALGLRGQLVGRAHECDHPATVEWLPVLTRARVDSSLSSAALDAAVRGVRARRLPLYELDADRLAALRPDVVITQAACEVCAVSFEQVDATLRQAALPARVVSLSPARLRDVIEDVREVAEACGAGSRGRALAGALDGRLLAVRSAHPLSRPRVVVVEWLEPLMLAGHWVPDAVEAAGAVYVGPAAGQASPYVSWTELRALAPDIVVVAPCGFDLARTVHESMSHRAWLASLAPRVVLMDGNAYWNRPGPRLVDAVEILHDVLAGRAVPASQAAPLLA